VKNGLTPEPHVIVIFGGNGDLSKRKLVPALYHLFAEGLLPDDWRVIGNSRKPYSTEQFHEFAREAIAEFSSCDPEPEAWEAFTSRLSYCSGEFAPGDTEPLEDAIRAAEREIGGDPRRLYYLSVPPPAFTSVTEALAEADLLTRARVVYEKPFGLNAASFRELNELTHRVLDDSQIYTIDHFLGKETLQNVLALRFANGMFEPVWNRQHIDHVEIDVPEELGIGGRAGFYEQTGALRDMVVTHLFQVLAVIAMEPPYALRAKPLLDEKSKVFESMLPLTGDDVVRGQFEGYREVDGVKPDSDTETFIAAKTYVDNWRWAGVPFYLRTGKQMAASRQMVTLAFKQPPRHLLGYAMGDGLPNDHLSLDMGGAGGIAITFLAKKPGPAIDLGPGRMSFQYEQSFGSALIGAYERLIHDALLGDRTLFTRADGIERTWELVEEILDVPPPLQPYAPGSWGPEAADALVAPHRWHLPEHDRNHG
jgi:glucose-6-phosphate 1-dehydrogenase